MLRPAKLVVALYILFMSLPTFASSCSGLFGVPGYLFKMERVMDKIGIPKYEADFFLKPDAKSRIWVVSLMDSDKYRSKPEFVKLLKWIAKEDPVPEVAWEVLRTLYGSEQSAWALEFAHQVYRETPSRLSSEIDPLSIGLANKILRLDFAQGKSAKTLGELVQSENHPTPERIAALLGLSKMDFSHTEPIFREIGAMDVPKSKPGYFLAYYSRVYMTQRTDDISTLNLYHKQPPKFFEKPMWAKFEKDGSDTFLLGGELAGKVVVRLIEKESFWAWQKTIENRELVLQKGYDVEPILTHAEALSFVSKERLQEWQSLFSEIENFAKIHNVVPVYTGVIRGINIGDHSTSILETTHKGAEKYGTSSALIELQKVMTGFGVTHGHLHTGNVMLNNEGKLFIIDFDRARISE